MDPGANGTSRQRRHAVPRVANERVTNHEFGEHYRQFVQPNVVRAELEERGFVIEHLETGMAWPSTTKRIRACAGSLPNSGDARAEATLTRLRRCVSEASVRPATGSKGRTTDGATSTSGSWHALFRCDRGEGRPLELASAPGTAPGSQVEVRWPPLDFDAWLAATSTDALMVMQDGEVLYEEYFDGMEPDDRHLIMSCSKSFTGVLCGAMVGDGLLTPGRLVTAHIPELAGTAWDGCTVQHLLDMRAGTRWDHELDERRILEISDYVTRTEPDLPADTAEWIRTIDNQQGHGGDFHYTSLMTDVLAWVLERAGGRAVPRPLLPPHLVAHRRGERRRADGGSKRVSACRGRVLHDAARLRAIRTAVRERGRGSPESGWCRHPGSSGCTFATRT